MAKAKKPDKGSSSEEKPKDEAKELITEALKRYRKSSEADRDNRDGYRADMLFTLKPGEQWDETTKTERGTDRPMYEFNELRIKCKNTINHIRANRPSAKIRGVEEGDKDLAEVRQGLCLNIWNNSDGDSITDSAAIHQVVGGMGAWRVDTEYSEDSVSEQDIKLNAFINPMCVLADQAARDELKRDARYWFVFSKITKEDFDAKYPKAERVSFEPDEKLEDDLNDEEHTWIAEYWKKVPVVKHLCLLSNGKTIDKSDPNNAELPPEITVVKERKVNSHKIVQYIISGDSVLEGPKDWAGSMFPFVPVYGEYVVVDGKTTWYGLPRFGKDAQRAHNWALTSVFESIASSSQAKVWATTEQAKGNTTQWAESNKKNFFFNLYNPDPKAPGPPIRIGGPDVPVALIQAAQMSALALNNSVGIYEANEGKTSNETSGKAIRARQDQGAVATYNFGDNMAKSVRRTYEILLDLIPHIYDTERALRILGQDGGEKYIKINQPDPYTGKVLNDMSAGKFDIVVTTGPSYATQRQEAADFYTQYSQSNPIVGAAASDLIIKAQDYPMADAIAERVKMMLPPQIQQQMNQDKPLPPEVQQAMQQAEQAMQQVQQHGQLVEKAAQEVQQEQAGVEKGKAEIQTLIANLKTEEAQFEAKVAKAVADITTKEAQLAVKEAQSGAEDDKRAVEGDRESLTQDAQQAVQTIQQLAGEFMQMAGQVMQQIDARTAQQQAPKRKQIRAKRINGELVAQIDELDDMGQVTGSREARVRRENGELVGEA